MTFLATDQCFLDTLPDDRKTIVPFVSFLLTTPNCSHYRTTASAKHAMMNEKVQEKSSPVAVAEEDGERQTDEKECNDEEGMHDLKKMSVDHLRGLAEVFAKPEWDPNLPTKEELEIDEKDKPVISSLSTEEEAAQDNSPYLEVRSAVPNFDSGEECSTIRAWVIGMLLATLGSGINALLSLRQPYISISSYVAQVVAYPIGCAWARYLPQGKFTIRGKEYMLNPGPFTKKEHTISVVMANATFSSGAAYATDIIVAQRAFYKQRFGWWFEMILCITNQMIGFGLAGFFNRFLVEPAAMIWPSNLATTALFGALHDRTIPDPAKTHGWKVGKYKFFYIVSIASFIWYWFPGVIAPFLSNFAFLTFIWPNNVVVNQLFGGYTGLSLLPMTLDWSQISGFNFSPLVAPWHALANALVSMVIFGWIVTMSLHYTNYQWSQYLPISDSHSYDNTGAHYNVSRILDPETKQFNLQLYESYSPLFLSTTFMLQYGLSFAAVSSVVVHTVLFHGKTTWAHMKAFYRGDDLMDSEQDVHARLMARYKRVPIWWYAVLLVVMSAGGMAICLSYDTKLTWWAFLFALFLGALFFLPIGIVLATTNIPIGLNVITEFIIGYIQPGRPMAMMLFKSYGYMTLNQGLGFSYDMKLAHYMKIPPRVTFFAQVISCFWSSIVQVAVVNWALSTIKDVCTAKQSFHFSCPGGRVFFNASIIWGAIGPAKIFSRGQLYGDMLYMFIPGFLLPIAVWLIVRRWPMSPARYIIAPVMFGALGLMPPATPLNYVSWALVGLFFNKYVRSRFRSWWLFYNYILSAGLDVGLAISSIVIFCALSLTNVEFPTWWGGPNGATQNTMDALDTAIRAKVAEGQTFGPRTW